MEITPAGNNLFRNGNDNPLRKSKAEDFHTMAVNDMFLSKRARPNKHPTLALLATRLISPNIIDWKNVMRVLKYLNGTSKYCLMLSIDEMRIINWYLDTSFAVYTYGS